MYIKLYYHLHVKFFIIFEKNIIKTYLSYVPLLNYLLTSFELPSFESGANNEEVPPLTRESCIALGFTELHWRLMSLGSDADEETLFSELDPTEITTSVTRLFEPIIKRHTEFLYSSQHTRQQITHSHGIIACYKLMTANGNGNGEQSEPSYSYSLLSSVEELQNLLSCGSQEMRDSFQDFVILADLDSESLSVLTSRSCKLHHIAELHETALSLDLVRKADELPRVVAIAKLCSFPLFSLINLQMKGKKLRALVLGEQNPIRRLSLYQ